MPLFYSELIVALQFEPDGSSRRARRTIAFYLGALFLLLAVFVGSARNVILVPWTARTNVTVASHGTHAYLFGGRGTDGDFLSGILRVDFASGRLKRSGTLPEPMLSTRVAVLADGNVLLAGGVTRTRTSDSLLIFHPENSRVSSAGTLFAPRAYGFASEIDGRVLYFGGFDGQKSVNTIVSIDPASGSSRIVGTLPVPVEQMGGAVVGGMVYLFGGENSAGQLFDSVLRYEPATGETKRVAVLPAAASRFSTAVVDGRILLCGGWGRERSRRF